MLLSECGGYTLNLRGSKKTYGYGAAKDQEELTKKIEDTKVYLKGKIDETGSIAGKLFKETWDKEYKRNVEIDSKIVDINKKLKS